MTLTDVRFMCLNLLSGTRVLKAVIISQIWTQALVRCPLTHEELIPGLVGLGARFIEGKFVKGCGTGLSCHLDLVDHFVWMWNCAVISSRRQAGVWFLTYSSQEGLGRDLHEQPHLGCDTQQMCI